MYAGNLYNTPVSQLPLTDHESMNPVRFCHGFGYNHSHALHAMVAIMRSYFVFVYNIQYLRY